MSSDTKLDLLQDQDPVILMAQSGICFKSISNISFLYQIDIYIIINEL